MSRSLRTVLALIAAALLIAASTPGAARQARPSADVLLGRALHLEQVEGDLEGAMALYQTLGNDRQAPRAVAARALLQLARCYQQLGRPEARALYQRVVREFQAERDVARQATEELARLTASASAALSIDRVRSLPSGATIVSRVSANGRFVAYLREDDSDSLFVQDLQTGSSRPVKADGGDLEILRAALSPDGTQVAYGGVGAPGVYVRNMTAESPPRFVPTPGNVVLPDAWSPDGRLIALVALHLDTAQVDLAVVPAAGGPARVLRTFTRGEWREPADDDLVHLAFSPDNRWLAFNLASHDGGNRDVYVAPVDGGEVVTAVTSPADELLAGWSPDGMRLVFATNRGGTLDLRSVPLERGRPVGPSTLLHADIGAADRTVGLGITQTGDVLTAICTRCITEVRISALDPGTGQIVGGPSVIESVIAGGQPAWSEDGRFLAYLSRRGRASSREITVLAIRDLATGAVRELLPNLASFANPIWSHTGETIFVLGRDLDGGAGLFGIDSRTGNVTRVFALGQDESMRLPQWSADRLKVYYRLTTGRESAFVERDVASGRTREIISRRPADFNALLLPARRQVAASLQSASTRSWSLDVIDVESGANETVTQWPATQRPVGAPFVSADAANAAVILDDPPAGLVRVMLVSMRTGAARELLTGSRPQRVPAVWWMPDGRSLLFRRTLPDGRDEIWWIPTDARPAHPLEIEPGSRLTVVGLRPDGRQIAFEAPSPATGDEIWAMRNSLSTRAPGLPGR